MKKIHPSCFREIDMMDEVKTFYRVLYRIDEASLHTEVLPLVRGDAF
jgi:hypothetical protein